MRQPGRRNSFLGRGSRALAASALKPSVIQTPHTRPSGSERRRDLSCTSEQGAGTPALGSARHHLPSTYVPECEANKPSSTPALVAVPAARSRSLFAPRIAWGPAVPRSAERAGYPAPDKVVVLVQGHETAHSRRVVEENPDVPLPRDAPVPRSTIATRFDCPWPPRWEMGRAPPRMWAHRVEEAVPPPCRLPRALTPWCPGWSAKRGVGPPPLPPSLPPAITPLDALRHTAYSHGRCGPSQDPRPPPLPPLCFRAFRPTVHVTPVTPSSGIPETPLEKSSG